MGSIARKMQRNNLKKGVATKSVNDIYNASLTEANKVASEIGHRIAAQGIQDFMDSFNLALENVLVNTMGYGPKRYDRFLTELNQHLPDHLQFTNLGLVNIDKEKAYDLVSILLEMGCGYKECKGRKYDMDKCKNIRAFKSLDIEEYDKEQEGCPYRVTPCEGCSSGKLTENQIRLLYLACEDIRNRK